MTKTTEQTTFVPEEEIRAVLAANRNPDQVRVRDILEKSAAKQRLEPAELAALIDAESPEQVATVFEGARRLKQEVYGNRIVLFAPLYVGNACTNDCLYCGFRQSNASVERRTLSDDGLKAEVQALMRRGHKRLILVYGEHPRYDAEFIAHTVRTVYAEKAGPGEIRRVNINAAPFDVEGFRKIKAAGIGTYQIFQETYHEPTYRQVHPTGRKSEFLWRLYGLDRAMEAGIDDVGIGALMGLYDWRFEVMGLLYHTIHLESRFGVGPHTISFPRIEPAVGTGFADSPPHRVSDADFKRLVALLRLAVPYTGLILTCRESVALRNEMVQFGVSQIDGGSNIGVGAYASGEKDTFKRSQFRLGDQRSLDEVLRELCEADLLPSFCTSCYRMGRTGQHFMEFAVPGFVKQFCTPNAVLTFMEYLEDYATPETKEKGLAMVRRELDRMPAGPAKAELESRVEQVRAGRRDLYF
jgi:2-iminoacetate synthase